MNLDTPKPGRSIFAGHVYSCESDSVAICAVDAPEVEVARLNVGEYPLHMAFRYIAPFSYAYLVTRSAAHLFDVSDPANPKSIADGKVSATAGPPGMAWQIMGAAVDGPTLFPLEGRVTYHVNKDRRLMRWKVGTTPPEFGGLTAVGVSQTGSAGLVVPFGMGARRLAAVWWGEHTSIVDISGPPFVVSSTLPYLPAMDVRAVPLEVGDAPVGAMHLIGHEGDKVFFADPYQRAMRTWQPTKAQAGAVAARWSVWSGLDTQDPQRIATLEAPGFWYSSPGLRTFVKDGQRYVLSGWTDGAEGEYVTVLRLAKNGELAVIANVLMPNKTVPHTIDFVGGRAWVWGYRPYIPPVGWRYDLIEIVGLPDAPRAISKELHP